MNEKILVADEEPATLKLLETILTQRGFQVQTASSGEDASQPSNSKTKIRLRE